MLTTNKKSVYIGISSGFILQIVGIFVKSPIGMNDALSAILFISGYFLLIWSVGYMHGKRDIVVHGDYWDYLVCWDL